MTFTPENTAHARVQHISCGVTYGISVGYDDERIRIFSRFLWADTIYNILLRFWAGNEGQADSVRLRKIVACVFGLIMRILREK